MKIPNPLDALVGRSLADQHAVLAALMENVLELPVVLVEGSAFQFYTSGVWSYPRLEVAADRVRATGLLKTWGFEARGTDLVNRERGLVVRIVADTRTSETFRWAGRRVRVAPLVETVADALARARSDREWFRRAELLVLAQRDELDRARLLELAQARGLGAWAETVLRSAPTS